MLGNGEDAATLEIPLTPARFRFRQAGAFALAGAACGATLAGRPLPRVWAGMADEGEVLELGPMTSGARTYLALPGGIDVPAVLGSRSTQLREGFGGLEGRVLAAGDLLRAAADTAPLPIAGFSLTMPALRAPGSQRSNCAPCPRPNTRISPRPRARRSGPRPTLSASKATARAIGWRASR
ncbi:hypothetical protein ACFSS8_13870 [Paracoccus kondratievae]